MLSSHSAFHWWSAQSVALLLLESDELTSWCAAGTVGCLDLKCRAFSPGGHGSAEWSRCPDSMAWHAGDSVAPLLRSSASWMPAMIGRLVNGIGRRHPVKVCKALLMTGSVWQVWALRYQTGAQYPAVELTRVKVDVRRVVAPALHPSQQAASKSADTVFVVLSFNFQVWRYSPTVAMSLLSSPPLLANLHQHAWLLGRQHMHTFWRWWLASQRCRCWREGVPRPRGTLFLKASWPAPFVITGGKGKAAISNKLHDHVDNMPVR